MDVVDLGGLLATHFWGRTAVGMSCGISTLLTSVKATYIRTCERMSSNTAIQGGVQFLDKAARRMEFGKIKEFRQVTSSCFRVVPCSFAQDKPGGDWFCYDDRLVLSL